MKRLLTHRTMAILLLALCTSACRTGAGERFSLKSSEQRIAAEAQKDPFPSAAEIGL